MSNLIVNESSFSEYFDKYKHIFLLEMDLKKAFDLLKNQFDKFIWIDNVNPSAHFYGEMALKNSKRSNLKTWLILNLIMEKNFILPQSKKEIIFRFESLRS